MHVASAPAWLEQQRGGAPLLLLAPHGGRRRARREPGRHKVNDLHTAALTRELARACDATSLVNATRDRNELDLNRLSQVRAHAPWLPALLATLLEEMVARAGRATVLVVHGWNVVQPACDVGIGMVEGPEGAAPVRPGSATVSPVFLRERLPRLRALVAPAGVAVTIGARYPAAHPNNLLQIFTAAAAADPDPAIRRIGALAAAGTIDAAQLELGIPLRWPGPLRDAFLAGLAATFGSGSPGAGAAPAAGSALAGGGRGVSHCTWQLATDDLVVLSSIDAAAEGGVAGRLLLCPRPGELALFTGELAARGDGAWHVPPLRYEGGGDGAWQLAFRGPLLSFPTLTPFLDLENGLARGRLIEGAVALAFEPLHAPGAAPPCAGRFGRVRGRVALDGWTRAIDDVAVLGAAALAGARRLPSLRVTLPDSAHGHLALASSAAEPAGTGTRFTLAGHACAPDHVTVGGTAHVVLGREDGSVALTLATPGAPATRLEATLDRVIPIRRPGRAGTVIRTAYARCRIAGRTAGWIELTTEHPLASPVS